MVAGSEEPHAQCIPVSIRLHIRYDILDYLLGIIVGPVEMSSVVLVVHFTVGYVIRVGGVYYSWHTFIITKKGPSRM